MYLTQPPCSFSYHETSFIITQNHRIDPVKEVTIRHGGFMYPAYS